MPERMIYISHSSALHYWRTNPPWYVLEGTDQNIRKLKNCARNREEIDSFSLPESEFGKRPIEVLIPPGAFRPRVGFTCHVQTQPLPPHALVPLYNGIHVVSPELCLVQAFNKLSFCEALQVGMEFCGTYALRPEGVEDKASRDYRLVDASAFARHVDSWTGISGLPAARKGAQYLVNDSASPMETIVYLLLCLPRMYGGYNLGRPELNPEIKLPFDLQLVLRQEKVKPDLRWRKQKVVVEYDGGYHDEGPQAVKDEVRKAVLESLGYTVYRFKKQHVYDPVLFDRLALTLARKLGVRVRPLTLKQTYAREALRALLPKRSNAGI